MEISHNPATKRIQPGVAPFTVPLAKPLNTDLPDHTQLPDSDGNFVKNFQKHPQSIILTTSLEPVLAQLHPDGDYCIGQDSGLYWQPTEPTEYRVEAPDWFYVSGVPRLLNGMLRRSYVMWQEKIPPLIAIELVSGSGKEERDRTPYRPGTGKNGTGASRQKTGAGRCPGRATGQRTGRNGGLAGTATKGQIGRLSAFPGYQSGCDRVRTNRPGHRNQSGPPSAALSGSVGSVWAKCSSRSMACFLA